jgi:hypothetical protein
LIGGAAVLIPAIKIVGMAVANLFFKNTMAHRMMRGVFELEFRGRER